MLGPYQSGFQNYLSNFFRGGCTPSSPQQPLRPQGIQNFPSSFGYVQQGLSAPQQFSQPRVDQTMLLVGILSSAISSFERLIGGIISALTGAPMSSAQEPMGLAHGSTYQPLAYFGESQQQMTKIGEGQNYDGGLFSKVGKLFSSTKDFFTGENSLFSKASDWVGSLFGGGSSSGGFWSGVKDVAGNIFSKITSWF